MPHFITGVSTGIGAGIAKVLAYEGAKVTMVARRADLLDQVAAKIHNQVGVKLFTIVGDIMVIEHITRIMNTSIAAIASKMIADAFKRRS